MNGHSDWKDDDFRPGVPVFIPIFFVFFGLFILLMCICCCVIAKKRQRQLWANIDANPTRPAFEIYPPVARQQVPTPVAPPMAPLSTPAVNSDVPPNYRAVIEPVVPTAPICDDSFNQYPEVTGGKTEETPPPAYWSVVTPFK